MKLDTGFHSNAKVLAIGNAGAGLYARALAYCGDHETDGFVPASWARSAGHKRVRDDLERHGLWNAVTKGATSTLETGRELGPIDVESPTDGYVIPDYLLQNLCSHEITTRRQGSHERMQRFRARHPQPSQRPPRATSQQARNNSVGNATKEVELEDKSSLHGESNPTVCPICRTGGFTGPVQLTAHLGIQHETYGDQAALLLGLKAGS